MKALALRIARHLLCMTLPLLAAPAFAEDPVLALQQSILLGTPVRPVLRGELQTPPPIAQVDHTEESADIWQRVRAGFAMQNLQGDIVDGRMRFYLARPGAITTMLERSRKYLFHIVSELEKRGMPTELALLPVVESAYNPAALSSAKAAGLWQFIPSTGKDFQLTQNWWVDERRDIIASTDAALKYLQAIYEMHGDWHLALASYNWGENAVARAINNNRNAGKPTDYMSLRMPEETRYYVPKLQAIKNLIAHPERYGIRLPEIPNEPYFTTVEKQHRMDVTVAARLAELPTTDFLMLNPGYNRPVMPGRAEASIVLPVANADRFRRNLAHHLATSDKPLSTWKTWVVPRTTRIEQIAKDLGIAVQALREANGLAARALLAAGYQLLIPSSLSDPVPEILGKLSQSARTKPVKKTTVKKPAQVKRKATVRKANGG